MTRKSCPDRHHISPKTIVDRIHLKTWKPGKNQKKVANTGAGVVLMLDVQDGTCEYVSVFRSLTNLARIGDVATKTVITPGRQAFRGEHHVLTAKNTTTMEVIDRELVPDARRISVDNTPGALGRSTHTRRSMLAT